MRELTMTLMEEMKGLIEDTIKAAGVSILDMDAEQFAMVQRYYKLMNISEELMVKQATMMDETDRKIDKLLAKMEEKA